MRRTLSASAVVRVVGCVVALASFATFATWRHLVQSPTRLAQAASAATLPATANGTHLLAAYQKQPLGFEPNQGQTDARVQFLTRGSGYTVFLAGTEADIRLQTPPPATTNPLTSATAHHTAAGAVVRIALAHSNPHAQAEGSGVLAAHRNYLIGNDRAKWRRNVPQFGRVHYRNVYPGVDLVYYGNQGQLESDYVVAPGADPRQIALQVTGQRSLKLNSEGDVVLNTAAGDIFLRRPRAYQGSGSATQEVAASYEAPKGTQFIRIKLGAYDSTQPLIIDPVLAYSTYLGGTLNNFPMGIAVDSAGFAYITGFTTSTDFPTTAGTLQTTPKNTKGTVFVSKLSKDGTALVYSTFLGGTGTVGESAHAIGVNSSGDAYIIGNTSSSDFPITAATAYQSTYRGGGGFFTVLDPVGAALIYSTYLNGSGVDRLQGLAIDGNGEAYIVGATTSTDFPIVAGTAVQTSNNVTGSQIGTGFLSRIDPTKVGTGSLVYSTYLGGSKEDSATGVAVDAAANAYVAGFTSSADFPQPAAKTGFQTTLRNPSGNAFVARIDTSQPQTLIYSTYLGGTPNGFGSNPGDVGSAIGLGPTGDAYMFGYSYAPDYPLLNAFDTQSNTFEAKAVISRIDTTKIGAASLIYSSFLGGTTSNPNIQVHGSDLAFAGAVDSTGNIYVAGTSSSIDFPTTPGAPQTTRVGQQNAFATKLNPAGSAILFSTYLGGSEEAAYSMALDTATTPNIYITGLTSGSFPVTAGAFQFSDNVTGQNNQDGFVAKLSPGDVTGIFASPGFINFGSQTVKVASNPKTITLFNDSSSSITITGSSFSGGNPGDYGQTTTCTGTLAAGSTCTYSITFLPLATGLSNATFSIATDDSGSPHVVGLSGTGAAAPSVIVVTPTTLTFGTSPQTATLTNNGTSALTVTGITITGPNAADFQQTNTCGATVAAGANCSISVTFISSTTGAESATLNIADSDVSSPQTVALNAPSSVPDFTLAAVPPSVSVTAGSTGTFAVGASSQNNFAGTIAFTCTGAPVEASCTLAPTSVSLAAGALASTTASVATTTRTIAPPTSFRRIPAYPAGIGAWAAIGFLLFVFWVAKRRRGLRKLAWSLAAVALFTVTSCSGVPHRGTPAGTYTLTVTATSGSLTHSTTVSLTVN